MRIGLSGNTTSVERTVEQAQGIEADGFSAIWYAGPLGGDALLSIAFAGRATSTVELGTSVVQTYPCHPVLQASRALAAAEAVGGDRVTLGVGPSHQPVIEGAYGLPYDHPGRHTEEYVTALAPLLRGEPVDLDGEDVTVHAVPRRPPTVRVPLLVAALGSRLLRVAGERADGTILWMTPPKAISDHVVPRITAAAERAGRPAPRVVAGLPVAVHDDVDEARAVAAEQFAGYGRLPNYRRILDIGGVAGPAEAAIVGDEASVAAQVGELFERGATDVWAEIFPVGDDRGASRRRTRALLKELAAS